MAITEQDVMAKLRKVEDPELHYNIVDLGLVYGATIDKGLVTVRMTLTSPACPVGPFIIAEVEEAVKKIKGVTGVTVTIVWEPPWGVDRISEEAKLELGIN
jgi:metal-sulfur cluster biosynthetic enzyme